MTTFSAAKDNPKGYKKAEKQPSSISASLKTIMNYGGSTIGKKDSGMIKKVGSDLANARETRKHLVRFGTKMGEDSQRSQGEDGQDTFVTKKVDDKNVANDVEQVSKGKGISFVFIFQNFLRPMN
jgi:hypothetical protein